MNFNKQTIQPHGRIAIRRAVAELMVQAVDLPEDKWFISRPNALFVEETPCGLIYFTEETAEDNESAPRYYTRNLNLVIDLLQYADSEAEYNVEEWLDSRAYEVEAAFSADRQLGLPKLVQDSKLQQTELVNVPEDSGNKKVSAVRLLWLVEYVMPDYGSVSLEEFLRFQHDIQSNSPQGANIDALTTIRSE